MKTRVYFFSPLELRNHMEDRCIAALCGGPGVPYQDLSHPTALGLSRLIAVACTMTWCRLVFGASGRWLQRREKRERTQGVCK